jgi:broad specificity phosphatase PhoE
MFLLRHGQSYFNLHFNATRVDPGIEDPELTPLGLEQAAAAAQRLADAALTRIIISPYTRALQTAQPVLAIHKVPVEIMHEVREQAAFTCDIGSAPDVLANRFPQHDFAHLPSQWWPGGVESTAQIKERANAFRVHMAERRDRATTLLVGHWAFIQALSGVALGNGEILEYDPCG